MVYVLCFGRVTQVTFNPAYRPKQFLASMYNKTEMAAAAAATAASFYEAAVAAAERRETEAQKTALKAMVTDLLGYSCKIACQAEKEWVEIFVLSDRLGKVTDYLEIQPSGAVGVIFDLYDDPESDEVGDLSDRCDAYNEGLGLEFVERDESSGSGSDEEEES